MFRRSIINIFKKIHFFIPHLQNGFYRSCSTNNPRHGNKINDFLVLSKDLEVAINNQIHKELRAAYAYIAMVEFYDRPNIDLPGFAQDHSGQVEEELEHAQILISLLSQRGGTLSLKPIKPPERKEWQSPLDVVRFGLQLEKNTAIGLMDVLNVAAGAQDHFVYHTINACLMSEQMKCIYELEPLQAKLQLCSTPNYLLLLDNSLLKSTK